MREILFRGKTTKDKEWVCGDLLHDGYDYDVAIWEQKFLPKPWASSPG